jgi:hypothetical protein
MRIVEILQGGSNLETVDIMPFWGVDGKNFADIRMLGMVSPWMQRGTIMQYMRSSCYDPRMHRYLLVRAVRYNMDSD